MIGVRERIAEIGFDLEIQASKIVRNGSYSVGWNASFVMFDLTYSDLKTTIYLSEIDKIEARMVVNGRSVGSVSASWNTNSRRTVSTILDGMRAFLSESTRLDSLKFMFAGFASPEECARKFLAMKGSQHLDVPVDVQMEIYEILGKEAAFRISRPCPELIYLCGSSANLKNTGLFR